MKAAEELLLEENGNIERAEDSKNLNVKMMTKLKI